MTVQDYLTTDELIYSERMCLADREGPVMGSNDSDTALLGRVLAGKKKSTFSNSIDVRRRRRWLKKKATVDVIGPREEGERGPA